MDPQALNVRVDPDVVAKIDEAAAGEMRSRSGAVRCGAVRCGAVRILLAEALTRRIAEAERAEQEAS